MNLSSPIESLIPGLRGRVLTALVRSSRPIALRELTRKVHSTGHSSVKRVLTELMDEGMVTYALVSKGAQFFELNRAHILVQHLVAIDHAKDSVLDVIREEASSWQRAPRSVVLFGSVARGEDTAASDVDLLVVWKGEKAPTDDWNADKVRLGERVYTLTGNSVNVIEFSAREWEGAVEHGEPLVESIARDGLLVVGTALRTLVHPTRRPASR